MKPFGIILKPFLEPFEANTSLRQTGIMIQIEDLDKIEDSDKIEYSDTIKNSDITEHSNKIHRYTNKLGYNRTLR